MKLEQSKNFNSNYACKFVKITNVRKHTNADRLQITTIDGNNIVVGLDTKVGDTVLYFPVECAIEPWFLSSKNLYRVSKDENLNVDKESSGGFFEKHGRVRAMMLRGERSEGFVVTIDSYVTDSEFGVEFDTLDGQLLAKKYIPKTSRTPGQGNGKSKSRQSEKKFDRILEEQFRYHIDTAQFMKNIHRFHPSDLVSVTSKLHGTSAIFSNVLTKRELPWYEKILKKLGVNVVENVYDVLYSSRKVIKNKYINKTVNAGFYNEDVWEKHYETLKSIIDKGITLYGEIVGYVNETKMVQGGFDYGCKPGTSEFYLYRVTYTNVDGKVYEFSARQVQQYAQRYGIKAVPEIFYGRWAEFIGEEFTKDWYGVVDDRGYEMLNNKIADYLRDKYLEGLDPMCQLQAPFEGIVIRKEVDSIEPYKFKSFRFLKKESEMLDSGEVDMETAESEDTNE